MGERRRTRRAPAAALAAAVATVVVALTAGPTLAVLTRQVTAPGNVFATAATFCRDRQATFVTGFEFGPLASLGPFDAAATAGGTPTIDATVKRNGAYSARVAKTSAGASSLSRNSAGTGLVARLAIRLDTLPAANVSQLLTVNVTGGSPLHLRYQAAQRRFEMSLGTTVATAGTTVQAATWYRIDLRLSGAAGARSVSWRVDGAVQPGISVAEATPSVTGVTFGSGTASDVFTAHYDDVLLTHADREYPLGDGRVLALAPNASPLSGHAGATAFRYESGAAIDANAYQRLDDVPVNSTADYVRQSTASAGSYLQLQLADPVAGCVDAIQALAAFHSAAKVGNDTTNHGAATVVDGASVTTVHDGPMFSTSLLYRSAVLAPPSGVWTTAAVSALAVRVGYSTDVSPAPYWDAVQLEYDVLAP